MKNALNKIFGVLVLRAQTWNEYNLMKGGYASQLVVFEESDQESKEREIKFHQVEIFFEYFK